MITVSSIFRDSEPYANRYFDQIEKLRNLVDVRLVIAEGDSRDQTKDMIRARMEPGDKLVVVNVGGRKWPSVDLFPRWQQIAKVVRALVSRVGDPGDAFLYVESDLIWHAETMQVLVGDLTERETREIRAVAPMVMAANSSRFYDIWGFRKKGQRFAPYPPYWPGDPNEGPLVQIDSCGSCFAVSPIGWPSVASWSGMWPFTADGWLYMDPSLRIEHP